VRFGCYRVMLSNSTRRFNAYSAYSALRFPRCRRPGTPNTPPTLDMNRKTVVGIGKAKKFMIGPGRGLPVRAFPDPQTRKCLQMYCNRNGITQKMLEQQYFDYQEMIEGRFHADGMKKKWYDFSLDTVIEIFDKHRIEMVAYVILIHIYHREYPGLPPHDGKDPRGEERGVGSVGISIHKLIPPTRRFARHVAGISFARYIIWSCEICRLKDYEMIELFFKCLMQKPNLEPSLFFNMGMLPAFFETIHRNWKTNKFLRYVVWEMLPHNNEGLKYSDLIRFSFKYPPLLFPILDFQKMWRRKMYGERFWNERVAEMHARPVEVREEERGDDCSSQASF